MPGNRILYFAYGSNMNAGQMENRCPGACLLGRATLTGYRFLINETGYATIARSEKDRVEGVLWHLEPGHLEALDRYEEHLEGVYDRCYRLVREEGSEPLMALVYIDHLRVRAGRPNPGYLERVIEGAEQNGLPEEYIRQLESFAGV